MRKLFILCMLMILALPVMVFAQDGTITYDQTVTGEISDSTPAINYTFEGAQGDVIRIAMNATQQGLDSYLELRGPNGDLLYSDDDAGGNLNSLIVPFILPETGTYTITASRCCAGQGGSSGTFELTLTQAELNPLALDETYTIELTSENPTTYFTYEAPESQILSVSGNIVSDSVGANLEVRDSSGTWVNSGYGSPDFPLTIDPLYLGTSGQYLFLLRRETSYGPDGEPVPGGNPITITLTVRGASAQPIDFGTPVSGELNDETPSAYYTFDGSSGDILRLVADQPADSLPFDIQVLNPNGVAFNGGSPAYSPTPGQLVIDPLSLDIAGEYLIVVRRLSTSGPVEGTTSSYTITLNQTETPQLENGVEVTNTVGGQTYERVYRYNGTAEQTVRFTLRSVSESYSPSMNVQGPAPQVGDATTQMGGGGGGIPGGFYVNVSSSHGAVVTYEVTLPVDGVYLFRVNNSAFGSEGPSVGEFSLTVEVVE